MPHEGDAPAVVELVDDPPVAWLADNTHATPLIYSALLASADFVIDGNVAHDAHGIPILLPVESGGKLPEPWNARSPRHIPAAPA
jgi:hypothetical protein